jgi:hypothetical protein
MRLSIMAAAAIVILSCLGLQSCCVHDRTSGDTQAVAIQVPHDIYTIRGNANFLERFDSPMFGSSSQPSKRTIASKIIFRVVSITPALINNPSLIDDSWEAELTRLDSSGVIDESQDNSYRLHYDGNGSYRFVVLQGDKIAICFDANGSVVSIVHW